MNGLTKKNWISGLVAAALVLAFGFVVLPMGWSLFADGKVIAFAWGVLFVLQLFSGCALLDDRIWDNKKWLSILRTQLIIIPLGMLAMLLTAYSGQIDLPGAPVYPADTQRLLFGVILQGALCVMALVLLVRSYRSAK